MTRSDAIRQALDASRSNPRVRWYAVATPRDPETYVVTTSLCPGDIIAAVARRGALLQETTAATQRRSRRPLRRVHPFCHVCEQRVAPPLEQHLAACHPACTVARPVAVRGLPVLGLNARGSGHHYRQEV